MPTQNNHAMHIFQQVMSTGLTLNMYISTFAMCWFQQTMSTKYSIFITTPSIIHDQDFVFIKVFAKIAIFSIKMSESKICLRLTQATNTYKHISRNIGTTMTASKKLTHDKVINVSQKQPFKIKKIALQSKTVIALNLYIDINKLVYERRLMMKVFSMTKFCVKKTIFCKNSCIFFKNVRIVNIFVVNPSPQLLNTNI